MVSEEKILNEIRTLVSKSNKFLFDDCAEIEKNLIVTTDTLVENVHFELKNYLPYEIGWKAIAVNLSDIASMGGKPLYALVSLSLPTKYNLNFIKNLYLGINKCSKKYKTQIIGGNITSSNELSITVTIIGRSKKSAKRNLAKAGDLVFVTGSFGNAGQGYLEMKNNFKNPNKLFLKSLKLPIPRIEIGSKISSLCKRVCMMDASDGLADCILQISEQSKVKIIIYEDKIPLLHNLKSIYKGNKEKLMDMVLYGGEDYELVGTVSKNDYRKLRRLNIIKIIGEVYKTSSNTNTVNALLKQNNSLLVKLSKEKRFKHFKN